MGVAWAFMDYLDTKGCRGHRFSSPEGCLGAGLIASISKRSTSCIWMFLFVPDFTHSELASSILGDGILCQFIRKV